jgi:hypothetical protein
MVNGVTALRWMNSAGGLTLSHAETAAPAIERSNAPPGSFPRQYNWNLEIVDETGNNWRASLALDSRGRLSPRRLCSGSEA